MLAMNKERMFARPSMIIFNDDISNTSNPKKHKNRHALSVGSLEHTQLKQIHTQNRLTVRMNMDKKQLPPLSI
jgi:hypothetical protein